MFDYVLANLLANNEHAVGALFLDDSGETVGMACADFTPYQMRIVGAYLGIYLRQLDRFFDGAALGSAKLIHIEKQGLHIHALLLPDGYYLALIQRRPSLVARARAALADAGSQLRRELFDT
ncbi:MAG: hypothetical protein ABI609_10575 [Acidobacteriota bacterium]